MSSVSNFEKIHYEWGGSRRIIVGVLRENANVRQALQEACSHLNWVGTFHCFDVLGSAEIVGADGKFEIEKGQPLDQVFVNFDRQLDKTKAQDKQHEKHFKSGKNGLNL